MPNNSASMNFSIPMYDNIFVMQADTLDSDIRGTYYGDEVDLDFWNLLNLSMDSGRTYTTNYELTSGYTYTYYVSKNKFIITDSTNAVVFENDNIRGINDFCVDLETASSHQFHIIFDPFSDIYSFYKVVRLGSTYGSGEVASSGSCGTNNIFLPDRVRPYLSTDDDNPSWSISRLGVCANNITVDRIVYGLVVADVLSGYRLCSFDYSKLKPDNNFYYDLTSFVLTASLDRKQMISYLLDLSIILPDLCNNMFPQLLPIERAEETVNNRPVYEPWLIWKILEFITTRTTTDNPDKDFEVYSFDLSPVYE